MHAPAARIHRADEPKEQHMNWEQLKGQTRVVGGKMKERWAKLTDDDLMLLEGKKEVFLGNLLERSGMLKEEAEKQFDAFLEKMPTPTSSR
jgi:uncharacterized protein YjbJ (UPF0337 family)